MSWNFKTSTTEALKLGLGYAKESLDRHDQSFDRHPATEFGRNAILSDIASIEDALASAAPQADVIADARRYRHLVGTPDSCVDAVIDAEIGHVPVPPDQVAAVDEALGLVALPPIRISRRAHTLLTRMCQQRGLIIQAVVREMLEPGEATGDEVQPSQAGDPALGAVEYGKLDFGFTFAGMDLADGDKRLAAMLTMAVGNDHPAFDDLVALIFAARGKPATQAPAQAVAQPLSDEQAKQILKRSDLLDMFLSIGWYSAPRKGFDQHGLALIRDVERALGIGRSGGEDPK